MKHLSRFPLAFVRGYATASQSERESLLAEPINCATAEQDISALEDAMPSRRDRARSAIQSVTPVGAVTGLVTGSYDDRIEVLNGRTAAELTDRITLIETTCGLAKSDGTIAQEDKES